MVGENWAINQVAPRTDGTQKNVVDIMQTRSELYERINYHQFEDYLDNAFKK